MPGDIKHTAIMRHLQDREILYHAKLLELREIIAGWLQYIPATFPNYTCHAIQHSEEIIRQMSRLLFKDNNPSKPILEFSAEELYVLMAAAYLHDAGMVVSDKEKRNILESSEWRLWIGPDGPAAKRWTSVEELRHGSHPADPTIRAFLADRQLRFLIAEFVRGTHHERARDILEQYQSMLARFAFDDPSLLTTIADVCLSHGLSHHELQDPERFPARRDIRGGTVNVLFMAMLLRIGDLLDLSTDRACPLLMNAACPLPPESFAHWTKHACITQRLTAPDRIEIRAECKNQDEHRLLQDWCQWLVNEVAEAARILPHCLRHREWVPPMAIMDSPAPTITIRPAPGATYIPSKWTFELDHEAVFQRLVRDVYDHPLAFLRELVQNALDATRCRLYSDLVAKGLQPPQFTTQVDESCRFKYPIRVNLEEVAVHNELSGEMDKRQVLTIEDQGIGMDSDIVQRYFLQVGRSFYTTDEFRRGFRFVPSSRFGIGFLSVFAVSDHVVVETYKPDSHHQDGALRLTLTGPRSYLLIDHGTRRTSGTRIQVRLRRSIEPGAILEFLRRICPRVEFPIIVGEMDSVPTTIMAESFHDFAYSVPDVTTPEGLLVVRVFPTNRPGIEGEIYVFAQADPHGESWDRMSWAQHEYPKTNPRACAPRLPQNLICLHGIAIIQPRSPSDSKIMRVDIRTDALAPILARNSIRVFGRFQPDTLTVALESRWAEILEEHLATSHKARDPDGWKYKQKLVECFPMTQFWETAPGMLCVHRGKRRELLSLATFLEFPTFQTTFDIGRLHGRALEEDVPLSSAGNLPLLAACDLNALSEEHRLLIFKNRGVSSATILPSGQLAFTWGSVPPSAEPLNSEGPTPPIQLCSLPFSNTCSLAIHRTTDRVYHQIVANLNHPLIQWLCRVKEASLIGDHGLVRSQWLTLLRLFMDPMRYGGHNLGELNRYLNEWNKIAMLVPELRSPQLPLSPEIFSLPRTAEKIE
jgi:molecular chaperone HtpG